MPLNRVCFQLFQSATGFTNAPAMMYPSFRAVSWGTVAFGWGLQQQRMPEEVYEQFASSALWY